MDNALIRVRYDRNLMHEPRNVLVTQVHRGVIFFGMAFCNTNKDVFSKKVGRELAINRMEFEMQEIPESLLDKSVFFLNEEDNAGFCSLDKAKFLLSYFKTFRELSRKHSTRDGPWEW